MTGAARGARRAVLALLLACGSVPAARAATDHVVCAGSAALGAAQIACNWAGTSAPAEFCTFSWALVTLSGRPQVVDGSFMLEPGAINATVYQANGFARALSNPIVLCQARPRGSAEAASP